MGRRWRLGGPPARQLTSDGALAASIALLPDFVEEKGGHVLLMLKAAVPVLVSVTVCAALVVPTFWFPKLTLVGLRLTMGAGVTPVPLSPAPCGLFVALSITEIVAVRLPVAVGRKSTWIVHDAPTATNVPTHRSLLSPKSSGSVPPCRSPLMNSGAVPVLVSMTFCGALTVPTSCDP